MDWTVIIPTHNEGLELQRTVASVLDAAALYDRGGVDIVVGDDWCEDYSTEDLAVSYQADERVRVLRPEQRLGVTHIKRFAAENSLQADMLLFLDSHSRLSQDFFVVAASEIERTSGAGAIYAPRIYSLTNDEAPSFCGTRWNVRLNCEHVPGGVWPTTRAYPVFAGMGNVQIIPKSLYLDLNGFDSGLRGVWGWEDMEICVRAWLCGYEVKALPEAHAWSLFRKHFRHGGYDEAAYYDDMARVCTGLLDIEHAQETMWAYRAYRPATDAFARLAQDPDLVGALSQRRRKRFVRSTAWLFDKFRIPWQAD